MNPATDVSSTYGLLEINASPASLLESHRPPPANYTGGATVFATFVVADPSATALDAAVSYEVYVAVGRPGEPILQDVNVDRSIDPPGPSDGVAIQRFVTSDFVTQVTLLYCMEVANYYGGRNA